MAGKLIMLKGLPASGKSTWARAQRGYARVNKDDIRTELGQPWSKELEAKVVALRDERIELLLSNCLNVISDDTNLDPKHEVALRTVASKYPGVSFEVDDSFLNVDLHTCLRRNATRVGTARVPEKVIVDMLERYMVPADHIRRAAGPQLFLDLDGVFADFDGFIEKTFGNLGGRDNERPDFWDIVRTYGGRLYYDMDPLPYAKRLFEAMRPYNPIILTGCPWSITTAAEDKREWVANHLDADVPVICCKSRNKRLYARPGDILLDDWLKYEPLWTGMGGTFVHHVHPDCSIDKVRRLLG